MRAANEPTSIAQECEQQTDQPGLRSAFRRPMRGPWASSCIVMTPRLRSLPKRTVEYAPIISYESPSNSAVNGTSPDWICAVRLLPFVDDLEIGKRLLRIDKRRVRVEDGRAGLINDEDDRQAGFPKIFFARLRGADDAVRDIREAKRWRRPTRSSDCQRRPARPSR